MTWLSRKLIKRLGKRPRVCAYVASIEAPTVIRALETYKEKR